MESSDYDTFPFGIMGSLGECGKNCCSGVLMWTGVLRQPGKGEVALLPLLPGKLVRSYLCLSNLNGSFTKWDHLKLSGGPVHISLKKIG